MADFGLLIRDAREAKGVTGLHLAQELGVAQSTLTRLELGQLSNPPDPSLFRKLSDVLGLSPVRMLQALDYLQSHDDPAKQNDPPALTAIRSLLESREFTDDELNDLVYMVRGMVQMMSRKP